MRITANRAVTGHKRPYSIFPQALQNLNESYSRWLFSKGIAKVTVVFGKEPKSAVMRCRLASNESDLIYLNTDVSKWTNTYRSVYFVPHPERLFKRPTARDLVIGALSPLFSNVEVLVHEVMKIDFRESFESAEALRAWNLKTAGEATAQRRLAHSEVGGTRLLKFWSDIAYDTNRMEQHREACSNGRQGHFAVKRQKEESRISSFCEYLDPALSAEDSTENGPTPEIPDALEVVASNEARVQQSIEIAEDHVTLYCLVGIRFRRNLFC